MKWDVQHVKDLSLLERLSMLAFTNRLGNCCYGEISEIMPNVHNEATYL